MRINTGRINVHGEYEKYVSFSKAVLWKDRQLSLRPLTLERLAEKNIKVLNFIDEKKKERWIFTLEEVTEHGINKRVGQEEQVYFPISLAKIIKL